ncbi:MAG: zinc metalloprotease HtpX [Pseudomonadota bacterium]
MDTPTDLNKYSSTSVDWRDSLRSNSRRTYFVIGLFFLIYLALGVLVDMVLQTQYFPHATVSQLFQMVVTLQVFPIATLVMIGIAAISIMVTFSLGNKLMLMGTDSQEVTSASTDPEEKQLYNVIEEMKIAAGLRFMPRVYIINADYMNAFASGYSEESAMVAITRGLIQKLNRSELQAVMAHELSHIRHLDIKLTLMASVLANLMLLILDFFFRSMLYGSSRSESRNKLLPIILIVRFLLPIINILLLLYLSRRREFMADAGSVELMRDNQPLASALLKIQNDHFDNKDAIASAYEQTPHENVRREAYIFDPVQAGIEPMTSIADIFSTHPNMKDRLAAIGYKINSK